MKKLLFLILTFLSLTFFVSCEKDIITNELSYEINLDSIVNSVTTNQRTRDSLWFSAIFQHINYYIDSSLAKLQLNVTIINKDSITINNYITNNNNSYDTTIINNSTSVVNNNTINNNTINNIANYDTTIINNINKGRDTTIYIEVKQDPIYYSPIAYSATQPDCLSPTGSITLTGLPEGVWHISPFNIVSEGSTKTFTGLVAGTYNIVITTVTGYKSPTITIVINSVPSAPTSPIIGTITQPNRFNSTGSVELKGLPKEGVWILTRFPDKVTIVGSGEVTNVTGLKSFISGAKCTEATYTFTVTNSSGCTSAMSDKVVIKSYN